MMPLSSFFPLELRRLLLCLGYSHDGIFMSRRYGDGEVSVSTVYYPLVYASLHGGARVPVFCEDDPLSGLVKALKWMADHGCNDMDAETHYRILTGYGDGLLTADDITGAP